MGLTSSSELGIPSLASNVHATLRCWTFWRLICWRDEYRMLSGPPPYTGQSTDVGDCADRDAAARKSSACRARMAGVEILRWTRITLAAAALEEKEAR